MKCRDVCRALLVLSRRSSLIALAAGLIVAEGATSDRRDVPPPAGEGSGMYSLTAAADGTPYLSWIEPAGGKTHSLQFSTFRNGVWSAAREIARGDNWFVNWADHPTMAVLPNGTLAAHWLVNNGDREGSYGYGFRIAISKDEGATWREVYAGGTDNTEGYSGFVSMLPSADGFDAVYLGPPRPRTRETDADHTMTLSTVRFGVDGAVKSEVVADASACSCCSTSIVQTLDGPLVAYRDRASGEIRDISVVRLRQGAWTPPKTVLADGWHINACPTNAPALSALGSRVAMSWFTGAGGVPRVKVAFSLDAGMTFWPPQIVDGGRPVGWPATVLLDDGTAVVSWLESLGDGRGEIRLRRVWPSGRLGEVVVAAEASSGRSTGIPQMVKSGESLVLAWRTDRVLAAVLPIPVR
jgi:hypothetical protein